MQMSSSDLSSQFTITAPVRPAGAGQPPLPLRLRDDATGQSVAVDGMRCSLGSAPDNGLVLKDRYVSRYHATLVWRRGQLWLVDERSRNGTWVNGVRVERCQVGVGSRIVAGRSELRLVTGDDFHFKTRMIGQHPSMLRVFGQIERLGPAPVPVLILGETGTGKELVARALHDLSGAVAGEFEPLNCGAIPQELAESELFGHQRGAFTGAVRQQAGAFERADNGTLFLDELGELPLNLQPKLLRVLEDGKVRRVGDQTFRPVSVRVLAATHRDLPAEAACGTFRLDLYHRLAVGVVELPPLRQRVADIPLLAGHFLDEIKAGGLRPELTPAAMELLQRQQWPGNVRQLQHALYRAAHERGMRLDADCFDFVVRSECGASRAAEGFVQYQGRPFREIQREIYRKTVESCGGNRSAAADALGIPKSTFYDQLRQLDRE